MQPHTSPIVHAAGHVAHRALRPRHPVHVADARLSSSHTPRILVRAGARNGFACAVQAIEMNNILMVEMLNELDRDRPNSLLVTSTGWSVLHQVRPRTARIARWVFASCSRLVDVISFGGAVARGGLGRT